MHVYLTGATGFVGSYILRDLLAQGHTVRCLLRDKEAALAVDDASDVERVKGDVTEPKSLVGTMQGCDAVIHLVGIIEEKPSAGVTFERIHVEGTQHIVDEAREAGITRFVHMSANGAREEGVSAYQTTKWQAARYVRNAGFTHWTVFRPAIIFGDPGPDNPEFASQLVRDLIRPFPILPVFGDGSYRMQPVSVQEVASAFVQALTQTRSHGKTYCAAGPDVLPFVDVLDVLTRARGQKPKPKIYQPIWLVRPVVQTLGQFEFFPISPAQFEMLIEGNTCDNEAFYRDFQLTPVKFVPENLAYLQEA